MIRSISICIPQLIHQVQNPGTSIHAENESNNNVDACYLGSKFIILNHTMSTVDIYPYNASIKPVKNAPISYAAI